ncbi:hypothetical protein FPV67DRAFT_1096521 [Lyophyllum atratum]|nr:hypothetical protein FPV67DRAFT_1096521 [Lyophyllum atratum]
MILPRISTLAARRPSFKTHSDDLVQFAATAATLARDIGNISACPPAAAAASVVLLILETIQNIKTNQEACARLARRCAKILLDLDAQMTGRWESAPALLVKNLEKFRETLWSIHHYMTLHVDLNWRTRFAKKGSIEDAVTELDGLLSEASQAFQMSTLISIHYAVSSRRKKAPNESSLFLDDIPENESVEEPSSASRIQILPPIDLDKCLSISHQPEYDFHHYLESDLETCGQNVRQYRLSDVRTRPVSQSNSKFGWWSDASEASLKCGKFVLIKRYDRDEGVRREHWLRDLTLLRRLYHPNFPQLLGSSLRNSPVPFVLLGQVVPNSPQEAILECLYSTSLKECTYLVLRFFHQLQGVTIYLSDSLGLSQPQIQNFLDDAPIGIEHSDSVMLGLPVLSPGHIMTNRNHGLLECIQTLCLNMLPRSSRRCVTSDASEDEALLHELLVSVRKLIWTHHTDEGRLNGAYVPPRSFDEECYCKAADLPYAPRPNPSWRGFTPFPQAEELAVWDFGYIPKEKGMEGFVKFGNLIKDELAAFAADESVSGVQWIADDDNPINLPYLSQSDRMACWIMDVPQNYRITGQVIHRSYGSEEDAWQFLLQSGETLAEEFAIPLQDLRIKHKLDFDISYYKESAKWDQPPTTMHLLTAFDPTRTPYLSSNPGRGRISQSIPLLEFGWMCTIKLRIGAVQTVAVTGSETPRVLSGSPTPDLDIVVVEGS